MQVDEAMCTGCQALSSGLLDPMTGGAVVQNIGKVALSKNSADLGAADVTAFSRTTGSVSHLFSYSTSKTCGPTASIWSFSRFLK